MMGGKGLRIDHAEKLTAIAPLAPSDARLNRVAIASDFRPSSSKELVSGTRSITLAESVPVPQSECNTATLKFTAE